MSTTRCLQLLASRRSRPSANLLPLLTSTSPHPLAALRSSHILCTPATYSRPTILQTGGQKLLFRIKRRTRHSVNKAEPSANENTAEDIEIRNSTASKSKENELSSQAGRAKSVIEELMQRQLGEEELAILRERIGKLEKAISQDAGDPEPPKIWVEDEFKTGIKYRPPDSLVYTSGADWEFQPHPDLYETLAKNVFDHYTFYKNNQIDKTNIPAYFYIGGAGTGKSRSSSEFASSLQEAIKIKSYTQHPLYHELSQRLEAAYVFHISFESGTQLAPTEFDLWNAVGIRMLHQLLDEPLDVLIDKYEATPEAIFRLIAAAAKVDFYNNFTGILIVDGAQKAFDSPNDGMVENSAFHRLLGKISSLSLMTRINPPEGERKAPLIMTCVTATYFGPIAKFIADSHRHRVYLPLKRLDPPIWKKDKLPVFDDSPITKLLVEDVGGHARAVEVLATELAPYKNNLRPNMKDLANKVFHNLNEKYKEALGELREDILPVVQCILSRRLIDIQDSIPGLDRPWESATRNGLIWFEPKAKADSDFKGYLRAPYVWFWALARLSPSGDAHLKRLCDFLRVWNFNDDAKLFYLETGEGTDRITWQSFEAFCCSFRVLRSLGFGHKEKVLLKDLHSGCEFSDDRGIVINRHLENAEATRPYDTNSALDGEPWEAEKVDTTRGLLGHKKQLSYVICNSTSAQAGDFFLRIEMVAQQEPRRKGSKRKRSKRKGSEGKIVREVGQCKLIRTEKITQSMYDREREKSAGPDDIFILYTPAYRSDKLVLSGRSGIVDGSCWDDYFGPFAGRAFRAWNIKDSSDKN